MSYDPLLSIFICLFAKRSGRPGLWSTLDLAPCPDSRHHLLICWTFHTPNSCPSSPHLAPPRPTPTGSPGPYSPCSGAPPDAHRSRCRPDSLRPPDTRHWSATRARVSAGTGPADACPHPRARAPGQPGPPSLPCPASRSPARSSRTPGSRSARERPPCPRAPRRAPGVRGGGASAGETDPRRRRGREGAADLFSLAAKEAPPAGGPRGAGAARQSQPLKAPSSSLRAATAVLRRWRRRLLPPPGRKGESQLPRTRARKHACWRHCGETGTSRLRFNSSRDACAHQPGPLLTPFPPAPLLGARPCPGSPSSVSGLCPRSQLRFQ